MAARLDRPAQLPANSALAVSSMRSLLQKKPMRYKKWGETWLRSLHLSRSSMNSPNVKSGCCIKPSFWYRFSRLRQEFHSSGVTLSGHRIGRLESAMQVELHRKLNAKRRAGFEPSGH